MAVRGIEYGGILANEFFGDRSGTAAHLYESRSPSQYFDGFDSVTGRFLPGSRLSKPNAGPRPAQEESGARPSGWR